MKFLCMAALLIGVSCARLPNIPIPPGIDPLEYVYVAAIQPESVVLAWGSTKGANTIGKTATDMAAAEVVIDGRTLPSSGKNFCAVPGLQPDTEYPYVVRMGGRDIAKGTVRTWPRESGKVTFFVIGDYGNGQAEQYRVAEAMRLALEQSPEPVRFVLTTGDNIYGAISSDTQWDKKFFRPYRAVLARIPFYATPGNHDGDESEAASNLTHYLDNFFFPTKPVDGTHAVYSFRYGTLAEFFALDSSNNTPAGQQPNYLRDGAQSKWLAGALRGSTARWKIPYFHHPIYSAGPEHVAMRGVDGARKLDHWVDLFEQNNVRAVFSGHEHNLQYTDIAKTGGVRYVVTGAGGKLRSNASAAVRQKHFIEGAADRVHFLRVEIDGANMRIHPLSYRLTGDNVTGVEPLLPTPISVTLP